MKLTKWKSIYREEEYPQIEKGMEVLGGRFKNKKLTVKDFDLDSKGQPVLKTDKGDRKIYTVRIPTEEIDTNNKNIEQE